MSKIRTVNPLGLYHVYNRGNNQESIFPTDDDKEVWMKLLIKYANIYNIKIISYCYMSNHLHLFIDDRDENISDFMRDVEAGYAEYYNKKYNRSGHVFQGRFGSEAVIGDKYVTRLIRYIERNPESSGIVKDYRNYKWSSAGESNETYRLADHRIVEVIFENAGIDYEKFMRNDSDDRLISKSEKQKFSYNEAKSIFLNKLMEKELILSEFNAADIKIKLNIFMKCRYLGVSIRQLVKISGEEFSLIRRACPSNMEYL